MKHISTTKETKSQSFEKKIGMKDLCSNTNSSRILTYNNLANGVKKLEK